MPSQAGKSWISRVNRRSTNPTKRTLTLLQSSAPQADG